MNGVAKMKKGRKKKNDEQLKVVYISSPMKVKTSASRFRSVVQELTGKNSDISQYMNDDDYSNLGSRDVYRQIDSSCDPHSLTNQTHSSLSRDDASTSSDSLNVFTSQMRDQFAGIFSINDSFYDPSQLDVLGSFDELI